MLDRELPPGEVALELEVGDAHRADCAGGRGGSAVRLVPGAVGASRRRILTGMPPLPDPGGPIVIVGSPTALGGHFAGMERTPAELRRRGLADRLAARPALDGATWRDHGDAANDPGWAPDPDPRAKNRARHRRLPGAARRPHGRGFARRPATTLGCSSSAATARRTPGRWPGSAGRGRGCGWASPGSMPMATSTRPTRRRRATSGACRSRWPAAGASRTSSRRSTGRPSREADAGLFGGQVLDEEESRMLAASPVAVFGAGMLGDPAGQAAVTAWAATVAGRIDAWYVAFDMDALDAGGRLGRGHARAGRSVARDGRRRPFGRSPPAGHPSSASAPRRSCSGRTESAVDADGRCRRRPGRGGARTLRRSSSPSTRAKPATRSVKTSTSRPLPIDDPARRRSAIDDHGVPPVSGDDQRPLEPTDRRPTGVLAVRDAAVVLGTEEPLAELEPGAARPLVGDAHPAATGRLVFAGVHEPAGRQDGAVHRPVDRRGDLLVEEAVVVRAGTEAGGSAFRGRRTGAGVVARLGGVGRDRFVGRGRLLGRCRFLGRRQGRCRSRRGSGPARRSPVVRSGWPRARCRRRQPASPGAAAWGATDAGRVSVPTRSNDVASRTGG